MLSYAVKCLCASVVFVLAGVTGVYMPIIHELRDTENADVQFTIKTVYECISNFCGRKIIGWNLKRTATTAPSCTTTTTNISSCTT